MVIKIHSIEEFRKTTCAVPWMHLAFEPSGKVVPCCLTSAHNYFVGDLGVQSIDEIWNGKKLKYLRWEMLHGIEPKICNKCFDREKVAGDSARLYHNADFPEVLKKIPFITEPDGTCKELKLKYWDFRFSNLCNFKCRSCGPRFSSAWIPDAKKLNWIKEDEEKVLSIEGINNNTNYDFLQDQVDYVEKIYFAGGEPLLMKEHWDILDLLKNNKKFNVKLSYNTNASTLTYNKKNVLDYWSLWNYNKVEVWPSIDEIKDRAELIRSGTIWNKVEENLISMSKLENIIIRPGITVGAFNVFRLPEIIEYLIEIGVIKKNPKLHLNYDNFFINLLEHPAHYHVHILPDDFKQEISNKINNYIEKHKSKYGASQFITHRFTHILHELTKPFSPSDAKKFIEISRQVDNLRNENIFETIPELHCIKTELFNKK